MTAKSPARPNRPKHEIYARPLPLNIHALPAFIPHNPLSLFRIAYVLLSELLYPPSSHAPASRRSLRRKPALEPHGAYFDSLTCTVQVTDATATRTLWEQGFFGKGSLSRSEPEWVERVLEAQRRKGEVHVRGAAGQRAKGKAKVKTAAEVTNERRAERKEAKRERARKEVEALEEVLRVEREGLASEVVAEIGSNEAVDAGNDLEQALDESYQAVDSGFEGSSQEVDSVIPEVTETRTLEPPLTHPPSVSALLENQEHLQLAHEEAFFLAYGLGIVKVHDDKTQRSLSNIELLARLCSSSEFPPKKLAKPRVGDEMHDPANPFLLSYVVYHHFRSLGWVVRPGIKFSVDFLLYLRGPVFSHAQFAVLILPAFTHPYWSETDERRASKDKSEKKDWWYFHCINRVQTQVLKTLVLCYVDVPPPVEENSTDQQPDIGGLLRRYRVREFVIKRWAPQRNLK